MSQYLRRLAAREQLGVTNEPEAFEGSELDKGLASSVQTLKSTGQAALGAITGNESYFTDADITEREGAKYQGKTQNFSDIDSLGSAGDWLKFQTGSALGSLAQMALGGGLGSAAVKRTAAEAGAKALAGAQAKNLAEREAAQLAAQAAGRITSAGVAGGMSATTYPQLFGENIQAMRHDREDGQLQDGDVGTAAVAAVFQTALDVAPVMSAFKKLGVGDAARAGITERLQPKLAQIGSTLGRSALYEGATEAAQETIKLAALEWVNEKKDHFTPKEFTQIMDSFAAGAVGGVVMGAAPATAQALRSNSTWVDPENPVLKNWNAYKDKRKKEAEVALNNGDHATAESIINELEVGSADIEQQLRDVNPSPSPVATSSPVPSPDLDVPTTTPVEPIVPAPIDTSTLELPAIKAQLRAGGLSEEVRSTLEAKAIELSQVQPVVNKGKQWDVQPDYLEHEPILPTSQNAPESTISSSPIAEDSQSANDNKQALDANQENQDPYGVLDRDSGELLPFESPKRWSPPPVQGMTAESLGMNPDAGLHEVTPQEQGINLADLVQSPHKQGIKLPSPDAGFYQEQEQGFNPRLAQRLHQQQNFNIEQPPAKVEPIEPQPFQSPESSQVANFVPTHELPDGTPVVAVPDEANVWRTQQGEELIEPNAKPIMSSKMGKSVPATNAASEPTKPNQDNVYDEQQTQLATQLHHQLQDDLAKRAPEERYRQMALSEKNNPPNVRHQELAKAILGKDVDYLVPKFVDGVFDSAEKVFNKTTGVRLKGLSEANKLKALLDWSGKSPQEQEQFIAKRQYNRQKKVLEERAKSARWDVMRTEGVDKTQWIDGLYSQGFNQVRDIKDKGLYAISDGKQYYKLPKFYKNYIEARAAYDAHINNEPSTAVEPIAPESATESKPESYNPTESTAASPVSEQALQTITGEFKQGKKVVLVTGTRATADTLKREGDIVVGKNWAAQLNSKVRDQRFIFEMDKLLDWDKAQAKLQTLVGQGNEIVIVTQRNPDELTSLKVFQNLC